MTTRNKRILVLGITGMLGNSAFRHISAIDEFSTYGTARSRTAARYFPDALKNNIIFNIDVLDTDSLLGVFADIKPNIVINCVGLIKQLTVANDPLVALPINAILPHRISKMCAASDARLIHISTDCVFSGEKGMYNEDDISDAHDLYGKSKYIGELHDDSHAITLRTSIIGHELSSSNGLVGWFLSQEGSVKGFTKAIFSGLPTSELARVMTEYVIPNEDLSGLYHVSASPINKYELLGLVAKEYGKNIEIIPDDSMVIDRSLDSSRFTRATGYVADEWPVLISKMHSNR